MGKYKHRLIFVDDEKLILASLQRVLRKEGYEIHTADSGSQALKILSDIGKPFSLIISDQRMPNMNGAQFFTQAKKICPKARRIMLSGQSDFDDLIAAVNNGQIHRFLSKPCNDRELILAIRQELDQYELVIENMRLLALTKKQNQQLFEVSRNLKKKMDQQTVEIRDKNNVLKISLKNIIQLSLSITATVNPELCAYMQEVAQISRKVGEQFKLDKERLEQLEIAGFMHDIGLLGISKKIIQQYPEKMSPEDFDIFSQHPFMSQSALLCIGTFKKASEIVLQHHERNDGSGFPKGLSGDEISLEGHILAVVSEYCWITKMWPKDMQGLRNKGKKHIGINLSDTQVNNCEVFAHSIAEKFLLMGSPQKYNMDVVTALIKLMSAKAHPPLEHEQVAVDQLEPGMVLAYNVKHIDKKQPLLTKGVTLTEELIELIQQFSEKGMIGQSSIYIKKQKKLDENPGDYAVQKE